MSKIDITVTDKAAQHLQNALKSSKDAIGIRFDIKDSGCSGYAYTIDFATEKLSDDLVLEVSPGLTLYIPQNSYSKALAGTEIDYVNEGVNQILKFTNPNAINECGCGESFQIKGEEQSD